MNPIFLHTGNRLEALLDALAEGMAKPLSDPFRPDTVLVQSRGMAHWLSMGLARRLGVCSRVEFPFPNAFFDEISAGLLGEPPEASPFDRGPMTFRLYELLEGFAPADEGPGRYVEEDPTGLKRYQLAARIADRFDQYQVYRPDWIDRWESGAPVDDPEARWQQRLWLRLTEAAGRRHRRERTRALLERLGENGDDGLPERLWVFGISYLPPLHFELLSALARRLPVHLFFVSPTREYWADIRSGREQVRIRRRSADAGEGDLHLEAGNRLLAAMGTMGRDFFSLAVSRDAQLVDRFADPGRDTLLHAVQQDILDLREPAPDGSPWEGAGVAADRSIQVHACHSPLREIEVLHDRLRDLFETRPDLDPSGVLVMTPDIDRYAPFIQAVFDAGSDPGSRIPYAIADRRLGGALRLADEFLGLFELKNARMTVPQVMGVLESEGVRRRFDLSGADVETVRGWLAEARIRWGVDATARASLGLPDTGENTWRDGLDRLLLGWAMGDGAAGNPFSGVYPSPAVDGGEGALLGRFATFLERLFRFAQSLGEPASLAGWAARLRHALDAFWRLSEPEEIGAQRVRGFLDELAACETLSHCREPVASEVVEAFLRERADADRRPGGFVSGGVTFCAMLPMRSIPADVVAIVGMDGDRFPREDRPPGFDLMSRSPRPGDRSRRLDDRYLFLEALLSARRLVHLSYVGLSVRDNSPVPPSVLVSELVDHLAEGYGVEPDALVVRHRLHAWSRAYFDGEDPALFSYSRRALAAARCLAAGRRDPAPQQPFVDGPLPPVPGLETTAPDLDALVRFYANPFRFFARERLGVFLDTDGVEDEQEAFRIDGLDRFRMGTELVAGAAGGQPPEALYRRSRGEGVLPHGAPGAVGFRSIWAEARRMAADTDALAGEKRLGPIAVSLRIDDRELSGRLEDCRPGGQVLARFGALRGPALLAAWLRHLALCAAAPAGVAPTTFLVAGKDRRVFGPVEEAPTHLGNLVRGFEEGRDRPMLLFADASPEFARRVLRGQEPPAALQAAAARLCGDRYRRGDLDDPYTALCTRGLDPLGTAFRQTALDVYGPLLTCLEKVG